MLREGVRGSLGCLSPVPCVVLAPVPPGGITADIFSFSLPRGLVPCVSAVQGHHSPDLPRGFRLLLFQHQCPGVIISKLQTVSQPCYFKFWPSSLLELPFLLVLDVLVKNNYVQAINKEWMIRFFPGPVKIACC